MTASELVDVVVVMVMAKGIREADQPAQGAPELGMRMLEHSTVHARPSCGGDRRVDAEGGGVWLNMQSKKYTKKRETGRGEKERRGGGKKDGVGRNPRTQRSPLGVVVVVGYSEALSGRLRGLYFQRRCQPRSLPPREAAH